MQKIIFTAFVIILASCSSKQKPLDKNAYEQSRQNVVSNESNHPLDFLKIEGDHHKNIFGKTVTKSVITNTATICSYKDVRIKMLSYDANGKMLEEHEDIFSDRIKPNSSEDFKTRYHLPKGVDSIALSIVNAVAVADTLK